MTSGVLANGGTYSWRVRGYDGSLYSKSWTSWCEFTVDTTKPVAPGISSVAYPQGQWNLTGGPGTFTFTSSDTGSGVGSWRYRLCGATPSTATGGSPTSVSITPPNGWHTLHVQAQRLALALRRVVQVQLHRLAAHRPAGLDLDAEAFQPGPLVGDRVRQAQPD